MSGPLKPICVACQRFYRPARNGVHFVEAMPRNGDVRAPPGDQAPELWKPYKLWRGDLWRCEGCGHELISGVAWTPISEHFMLNFAAHVAALEPIVQVNDC